MVERPTTLVTTLTCSCKRCGRTETLPGSYTQGRKYPFSCCGVAQMAKA